MSQNNPKRDRSRCYDVKRLEQISSENLNRGLLDFLFSSKTEIVIFDDDRSRMKRERVFDLLMKPRLKHCLLIVI